MPLRMKKKAASAFPTSVKVKVPATTANLGPGFDALGLALQIYNTVRVSRSTEVEPNAMADEAAKLFFKRSRTKAFRFQWSVTGDVPRSRGLGSSVTVRLGILHGLNELAGSPLNNDDLYELCADLEGHPDNAAPAAYGGFCIARKNRAVQRYRIDRHVEFALLIPEMEVLTADARRALPKAVPLADAVLSASHAALIAGAFASRDYTKLTGCFEDQLHQPYREHLVPFLSKVIAAGVKAGAVGGWLSGSGSTIACMTLGSPEKVARAMLAASGLQHATVVTAKADNNGVRVTVKD